MNITWEVRTIKLNRKKELIGTVKFFFKVFPCIVSPFCMWRLMHSKMWELKN